MNNSESKTPKILIIILVIVLALSAILYVLKTSFRIPITLGLMAANILVFVFIKTGKLSVGKLGTSYYDTIRGKQLYRIYTSAFTHREVWHIVTNMISLFNLGSILEPFLGSVRFLILYGIIATVGGFVSALFHSRKDPSVLSIGASGVLCGLLGMYITFVFTFRGLSGLIGIIPTMAILILQVFSKRIDSIAHFTGLAVGIVCGIVIMITI